MKDNKRVFKIRFFEYEDDEYVEKILDERKIKRIFGNDAAFLLNTVRTESKVYIEGKYVREEFTADLVDGNLVRYVKGHGYGKYNVQERNGKYIYPHNILETIAEQLKIPKESVIEYTFLKEDNRGYKANQIYDVKYFTNDYLVSLDINQIHEAVLDFDSVSIVFDKEHTIWLDDEKVYTLIMKVD